MQGLSPAWLKLSNAQPPAQMKRILHASHSGIAITLRFVHVATAASSSRQAGS